MSAVIWNEIDEANQARESHFLGAPESWFPFYKAGWGFKRLVSVPHEYLATDNELWTDFEPYWREDLGRLIWLPAACGSRLAGETWRAERHKAPATTGKDAG